MSDKWLLSKQQVAAFKRDGFFLARGILDPEVCLHCRDLMWAANEIPRLDRQGDMTGPITPEEAATVTKETGTDSASGYRWMTRNLGGEDAFVNVLPQVSSPLRCHLLTSSPPAGTDWLPLRDGLAAAERARQGHCQPVARRGRGGRDHEIQRRVRHAAIVKTQAIHATNYLPVRGV